MKNTLAFDWRLSDVCQFDQVLFCVLAAIIISSDIHNTDNLRRERERERGR